MLVDAAAAAGADIRFGVTVSGLERGDDGRVTGLVGHDAGGAPVHVRARLVVGADGPGSSVAEWVGAEATRRGRAAGAVAYGYWEGLDLHGYEWYFRPGVTAGAIPTNDGLTCVFVGTTPARFRAELAPRPQSAFASLLAEGAPELVDRMSGTRPPSQLRRFPGRPGHLRQAWGPGWALVGDAGYWKDPLSAHGLTDAMRDAELLARAVVAGLDDGDQEAELARYQATRDRLSTPLFDTTDAIAGYGWDVDAISALLLQLSSAMTDEVEALAALDVLAPATA
jgi:flavin-dependent dehydrogenase